MGWSVRIVVLAWVRHKSYRKSQNIERWVRRDRWDTHFWERVLFRISSYREILLLNMVAQVDQLARFLSSMSYVKGVSGPRIGGNDGFA